MDWESALVAKAIASGGLSDVIARGIDAEHFADDDVREVWDWSVDFYTSHRQPPSMSALRDEFPGFKPKLSQDPLGYHIDKFVDHCRERIAIEQVRAYHELLEDPDAINEIEVHALEMARVLAEVVPEPKVHRFSDGMKRHKEYLRRQAEGEIHGTYIGVPTIDRTTLGQQPHELCIYAGYMGTGKTTGMQHHCLSAYLQKRTSLFISLEVEAEQILRKFDVMMSNVRYHAMKALELDVGEEEQWTAILEQAESDKMERDIIIIDDIKNCTPEKVASNMMRYKPDIVFVDYLEEMRTPRVGKGMQGWEGVQENARGLKQNARVFKIPTVTATQLNREGGKGDVSLNTVSHQAAGKVADMLIGLQQDEEMYDSNEMEYVLLKYRDGSRSTRKPVILRWELERGIIKEKGHEERFPMRKGVKIDRKRGDRLQVANIIRDRENPLSPHKKKRKGGILAKKAANA